MINVLVAEMPRVQAELIESFVTQTDDIALFRLHEYASLSQALRETRADVVLLDTGASDLPAPYVELMRAHARVKLLAIEAGGRRGSLFELRPYRVPLGEVSPERLLEAIRRAGGPA